MVLSVSKVDNYTPASLANIQTFIFPLIILNLLQFQVANIESLNKIKEETISEVNPWRLFKTSEIILANNLSKKISETLAKFTTIDLNSISDSDKNVLLVLSDNSVPYEWRKMWQGPKLASEFLKSVSVRIQTVMKFLNS